MEFIASILLFVIILSCILILTRYWWRGNANEYEQFYEDIPGPPTLPLLGNALDMRAGLSTLLDTYMKYIKTYGGLVKVKIPGVEVVLISDYQLVNFILYRVFKRPEDCSFIRCWLRSSPLSSEVLDDKFNIIEQFVEVFESNGNKLIQELEQQVGNISVDIYPYVNSCAQDILCESFLGVSISSQDYGHGLGEIFQTVFEACILTAQLNFEYLFSKDHRNQRKFLRALRGKSNTVINQRRKELTAPEQKSENVEDDGVNTKKKRNFLDTLLQNEIDGAPFTVEDIRNEIITLIFEGQETTASALSFTLYCLATNPEVQQKAFEEQKSIFGNNKTKAATIGDLLNMKYLELVIKETLRLYPSIPYFGGVNPEPLVHANVLIPQGKNLLLFIYGMHRDPASFKDPEKFDPARFESMDGSGPKIYMPFGGKPQKCLGQRFTMFEIKTVTSKLMRNFEILPAVPHHSPKLIPEVVLKSNNGIKMRFKKRSNN